MENLRKQMKREGNARMWRQLCMCAPFGICLFLFACLSVQCTMCTYVWVCLFVCVSNRVSAVQFSILIELDTIFQTLNAKSQLKGPFYWHSWGTHTFSMHVSISDKQIVFFVCAASKECFFLSHSTHIKLNFRQDRLVSELLLYYPDFDQFKIR